MPSIQFLTLNLVLLLVSTVKSSDKIFKLWSAVFVYLTSTLFILQDFLWVSPPSVSFSPCVASFVQESDTLNTHKEKIKFRQTSLETKTHSKILMLLSDLEKIMFYIHSLHDLYKFHLFISVYMSNFSIHLPNFIFYWFL